MSTELSVYDKTFLNYNFSIFEIDELYILFKMKRHGIILIIGQWIYWNLVYKKKWIFTLDKFILLGRYVSILLIGSVDILHSIGESYYVCGQVMQHVANNICPRPEE